ncbi:MAG TPA: GTPase Era [Candidatus Magasanikbacteria bacterium]|nr:GTPase Era [Candidatus Magasanikbacteria bacterium]
MKSGFVVLVGRSNVGKSTLLNTLVGTKIAATSFRPQMTRNVIHGVVNTPAGQAVFVDTPGIFKAKRSDLSARLYNKVNDTLHEEIDVIVYVADPTREIGPEELATYGLVRHLDIPKILVINKCDLHPNERPFMESYQAWSKDFNATIELSALRGSHIQPLREKVVELLPEGDIMYPDEQLTNIDNKFWIAEIIREKIFSVMNEEIPYAIAVEVDDVEDKPEIVVVKGRILTLDDRYKKIIIGQGGKKIKEIGQMARRELEQAINKKVYLELEVETDKHWVERV